MEWSREKEIRRVTSTPECDTFENYHDTPPISILMLLPNDDLFLVRSTIGDTIATYRFFFGGGIFGNYYRKLYSMTSFWGINYCKVMIGAVLPWKE